jgi:pyruvate kinase
MERRTRIVATLGPSSQDEETINKLLQAGMDVARLNFSHGTHENHAMVYQRLRKAAEALGRPITIMQDLQGPKIRTGEIEGGQVTLNAGQKLTLTTQEVIGNDQQVSVDYPGLAESVQPGGRILLDDGNLELVVTAVQGSQVETQVVLGGPLKPHKGVNLPGAKINLPGLTEKDLDDLAFGLQLGVDGVAVSFVRSVEDIERLRAEIERRSPGRQPCLVAKLERPEALDNLEAIVQAADAVMVARGDLGVEMSPEIVPIAQKRIIETANRYAKIVITATQMLESMILKPRPTRAEASDVANAIFDGTDAVMLSGETASGSYPVQAVMMMDKIVCQAEANLEEWGRWHGQLDTGSCDDDTFFITGAAYELAKDRNVAALAVFSQSGRSARLLCKHRPNVPILAFTPRLDVYHRMNIYWGVKPYLVPHASTIEEMTAIVDQTILATQSVQPGQQVVLTCGYPLDEFSPGRPANLALLHTVGER